MINYFTTGAGGRLRLLRAAALVAESDAVGLKLAFGIVVIDAGFVHVGPRESRGYGCRFIPDSDVTGVLVAAPDAATGRLHQHFRLLVVVVVVVLLCFCVYVFVCVCVNVCKIVFHGSIRNKSAPQSIR